MRHYEQGTARAAIGRITYKGQLTIPKEIRDAAGLEDGDLVEICVQPGGKVVVTPKILIDKSQAWFWTPVWQKKEREAGEDLRRGRTRTFKNVKDLLKDLRSR